MATPQHALDAAYEGWNAGSLDRYLELYGDEIRLHGYSPEPMDKAGTCGVALDGLARGAGWIG